MRRTPDARIAAWLIAAAAITPTSAEEARDKIQDALVETMASRRAIARPAEEPAQHRVMVMLERPEGMTDATLDYRSAGGMARLQRGVDSRLRTGDIGEIDDEGFLRITDRKKEIIVNAYGKNVAPAPIENRLKSSRFIEQAVIIGDRRKFLSVLIVPDFEALGNWAAEHHLPSGDRAVLLADPRTRELFAADIERINADVAKYEMIRAFDLLPAEFSIAGGELTPTQKIKRRVVATKYAAVIDAIYERAEQHRPAPA
jgi:acyl-CoA synthetase (AMP-forming)/AMP-acid ligase II